MQDIYLLINISVLPTFLSNALSIIGLLYLRKVKPNEPRAYKVNLFFPITYLFFTTVIILMTFIRIPFHSGICKYNYYIDNYKHIFVRLFCF